MTAQPQTGITVEYLQNFHDWRDSLVAARVLNNKPYLQFIALAAGCAVLTLISLAADRAKLALIHLALMLIFSVIALMAKRLMNRRLRQKWDESRNTNLLLRIFFGEDGVVVDTDHMHTTLKWPAFIRYCETPRLIVCLVGTGNILALPKSRMSPETQTAIKDLLARKLQPPTFAFPVLPPGQANHS